MLRSFARVDDYVAILLGFLGYGLIEVVIRWLNPPPEPPEDEWQKWSKL